MKKIKLSKINIYLLYTALFVIVGLIVFSSFIINGKSFIWNTDGYKQHYVFLEAFNNTFRNLNFLDFSNFSWEAGLGLDVIGQFSYYLLGDPFCFISLLFPINQLELAYNFLIILRIYCVGLSFIAYCRHHQKNKFGTIIGALMYTFCEFILYGGVRHPFFINAAILLPLILLSVDKILEKDNYKFFILITALSAISNYYFLYMITLLTFIYAIIKYIVEYKQNGIKGFAKKIIKTIFAYIVGILIASILLLPTIYAFLSSGRTGTSYTYYSLSYYIKLFLMNGNIYWSKIYVCSIILIILPIAILSFKKKAENRTILLNLLVEFIILLIPFLGSVMNGFSFQSNRWTFGFAFLLSYLVTINLKSDLKYNKKELLSALICLILYTVLAVATLKHYGHFSIISVLFAYIILIVLIVKYEFTELKISNIFYQITVLLIIILNIGYFVWNLYVNKNYVKEFIDSNTIESKYSSLYNRISNFEEAIDYIKSIDNSFYRIGTNMYGANNLSLKYNYKSLNTYLSVGNGYIDSLSKDLLVLNRTKTNPLCEFDSRTQITTLLSCKYYVVSEGNSNYVPYGYKLIKKLGNSKNYTCIYENEYYLPIGVFYNNSTSTETYENLFPWDKEHTLLNTAVVDIDNAEAENVSSKYSPSVAKQIDYSIIDKKHIVKNNTIEVSKDKNSFELSFDTAPTDCELYLYIENLEYHSNKEYSVKVEYNGIKKKQTVRDKVSSAYYEYTPNIYMNLGYSENHSGKIKITLPSKGSYTFDDIKLIAIPMDSYRESIANFKKTSFVVDNFDNNSLTGHISTTENGILQISTSYSKGWTAYVDGVKTDIINVNTGFIGIPLNSGDHSVYLTYSTPYFNLGIAFSIIGIIIFGIVLFKKHKK